MKVSVFFFFFLHVKPKSHFPGDVLFLPLNDHHHVKIRGLEQQMWCSAHTGEATRALVQNTDVTLFDSVTSHQTAEPLLVSHSCNECMAAGRWSTSYLSSSEKLISKTIWRRTPLLENGHWLSSTFQLANAFFFFWDRDSVICCCLIQGGHMESHVCTGQDLKW